MHIHKLPAAVFARLPCVSRLDDGDDGVEGRRRSCHRLCCYDVAGCFLGHAVRGVRCPWCFSVCDVVVGRILIAGPCVLF